MRQIVLGFVVFTILPGCTHLQLLRHTLNQDRTLADLQCQQVLDNVARFVVNPGAMPYFAYASDGSTQVSDNGSASTMLTWDARSITSEALGLGAARTLTEGWGLVPINNPDKLYAMRCAYQYLTGNPSDQCDDCEGRFRSTLGDGYIQNPECYLPIGWFCTGKRRDVPRCACYVSHCCDTYVWVTPEGIDGLTRFTMTILDIATLAPPAVETRAERTAVPSTAETPAMRPRERPFVQPGPVFFPPP